jgi:hypothetical protein
MDNDGKDIHLTTDIPTQSQVRESFFYEIEERIRTWGNEQYAMGKADATQGNLLSEDKHTDTRQQET